MDIIVVKVNSKCFKKAITGLSAESEALMRKLLRIKSDPFACGYSDIQEGKQLKASMLNLDAEADILSNNSIKALRQYINKLDDSDQVVLLDESHFCNYDIFCWYKALEAYKNNQNPVVEYNSIRYDIPQKYFPRHDIYFFTDWGYDQYYGEPDKDKRICRFCSVRGANKFGDPKNSHAISYFLGNQALFCLEECKECNNTFGSTIEKALSDYYQYYRAAENRKSRKGKPLTAKGFNYEHMADGGLRYFTSEPIENAPKVGEHLPEEGLLIHLNNKEPVVLHDIYRVLVKYVIACMPNELLFAFKDTIKWIKGEKHPSKGTLPPVYRIETFADVRKPSLCVYIRKDDKKDLPYCIGELRFMENLYVFVVPYCKGHDAMNPYLAEPLSRFVKQRYPDMTFTVENYCDYEQKMIINHVKIEGDENTILEPLRTRQ